MLPGASEAFVTVDVEGAQLPGQPRSPVNLALVIDRSGSMNGPKLAHAKEAARHLVKQLGRGDRLSIVHYGSDVSALSSMPADPDGQARMLAYVDGIWDEGGTNISAGLEEARRQLLPFAREYRVSRVILLSDGQPTEGLVHDEALTALARQLRADGLSMSAIGVGEAFNEDLMQGFAEYGAGAYGYLREGAQLASLFERDLKQAATTVAQHVSLEFTVARGRRARERPRLSHRAAGTHRARGAPRSRRRADGARGGAAPAPGRGGGQDVGGLRAEAPLHRCAGPAARAWPRRGSRRR